MDDQFSSLIKSRMVKCFEITKNDLSTIRTGRATPALIEHIEFPAYGGSQRFKLNELATISANDAKMLLVHPFDPSTIDDIIKGLQTATWFLKTAEFCSKVNQLLW